MEDETGRGAAPVEIDEIDVTPEMIEAGVDALKLFLPEEDRRSLERMAEKCWRSMLSSLR